MAEDDKYVPSKGNSGLDPTNGGSAFVRDSKGLLTRKTDSGWFAGDGIEAVEKRNKEMASSAFERNSGGMLTRKSELEENNKTLAKMNESAFGRNRLGLLTRKEDIESNNKNDSVASISTQADFFKKSKPKNLDKTCPLAVGLDSIKSSKLDAVVRIVIRKSSISPIEFLIKASVSLRCSPVKF